MDECLSSFKLSARDLLSLLPSEDLPSCRSFNNNSQDFSPSSRSSSKCLAARVHLLVDLPLRV